MGTTVQIYPGSRGTQELRNPNASAARPMGLMHDDSIPVLPGLAKYAGLSVPALIALVIITVWLIEQYD
jgi:hypothetical protein